MATQNLIDVQLTEQDKADLNQALATVEARLSFLVGLSPEERQTLPKMGTQGRDFVRDVLTAAEQNPTLIPAAIDIAGLRRDYELVEDLTPMVSRLAQLVEGLNDTLLEAGSEAFVTSLEAYDILKRLGKGTNLDANLKKMSRRFAKRSSPPQTPTTE